MRRILSIWLSDFQFERLSRDEPGSVPAGVPFVLTSAKSGGLIVIAANPAALAANISTGQGLADARAVAPALLSRPAEPSRDAAALARLAREIERYGPAFNVDGRDGLWVDITGVSHLFGNEIKLGEDLIWRIKQMGFTPRIAIADGLGAAFALARYASRSSSSLLPKSDGKFFRARPGSNLTTLADLPIEALRLDTGVTSLLRRLGLKCIKQILALPRASLERRFHSRAATGAVLLRLDQALGSKQEPLNPMRPLPQHSVRAVFAEPLVADEGLQSALAALVSDLCRSLTASQRGARRLVLTLYRSDGTRSILRAGLSQPRRSVGHMIQLLRGKLDAIDAGFGIDVMLLSAVGTEPLISMQEDLSGATHQQQTDAEALACLIDRLSNRLGAAQVFKLVTSTSHVPERAESLVSALTRLKEQPARPCSRPRPVARPPFLLPSPEPITVSTGTTDGRPRQLGWRGTLRQIVSTEGPERIAPEWWHEIGETASRTRDYYKVEDESGVQLWLFREFEPCGLSSMEAASPRWYMHGFF